MIEKAKQYIETLFAGDSGGHDVFHTLRVLHLAERIAAEEGADLETVQLAALLHDADDRKLSPETHENQGNARAFLASQGMEQTKIDEICHIISQISFKGTGSTIPDTIEGKCVQDADRLDAIGAVGIARTFAFGGSKGRKMYDPSEPPNLNMDENAYAKNQGHTINHFYEKLLLLKDLMNTDAAKRLAEARHRFMEDFLSEFYAEWQGEK
ncbi:MAG: HD domain-containing protein [Clostridia bacterium]|nr:HD domain-containing protein [Clostridia bacterium]